MASAYVLINVDAGSDDKVANALRKIEGITKAHVVLGAADIIVEIDSKDPEAIHDIIYEKIRKIPEVRSTQTMTVVK
jgi:DNA-binding Lrp family transcriptional regulator